MKKKFLVVGCAVISVMFLSVGAFAGTQVAVKANITVSTGSQNGGWNTDCEKNLKLKMAKEGVAVTCSTSKGSIDNMTQVNSGEKDSGYVQTDMLYLAWQNDESYATNLNPGGRTFINEALMCATSNGAITGFKSFLDFGRPVKIITPPVGSGSEGTVRFLKDNLAGYADAIKIMPQDIPAGDSFSIDKAVSAMKSRNPRKRADAVCWVEIPRAKSEKIIAISKNLDLHWIPMDEPTVMDLAFEDSTVYPGVAPVYAGKKMQVTALQVGDTYIYNDNVPSSALAAFAKVIDQNPNYIDERSIFNKIGGMFSKAAKMTASVAKRAKGAAASAVDAASNAIN